MRRSPATAVLGGTLAFEPDAGSVVRELFGWDGCCAALPALIGDAAAGAAVTTTGAGGVRGLRASVGTVADIDNRMARKAGAASDRAGCIEDSWHEPGASNAAPHERESCDARPIQPCPIATARKRGFDSRHIC
jgi:hypothetical protein